MASHKYSLGTWKCCVCLTGVHLLMGDWQAAITVVYVNIITALHGNR